MRDAITYDQLDDVQKCLQNDKTLIKNSPWKFNYQLNAANKFQYLFQSDNKFRNARGASANTAKEAVTEQTSDEPWGFPLPTHSLTHTLIATRPAGVQQPVHLRARRLLPRLPGQLLDEELRRRTRATSASPTTTTTWSATALTRTACSTSSR